MAAALLGACLILAQAPLTAMGDDAAAPGPRASMLTPPPGSSERRAVLDALRAEIRRLHGLQVVFVVVDLRVKDGWAWVHTRPQSGDGQNHYEDIAALLRHRRSGWKVLEMSGGDPAEARRRHPGAPAEIFRAP